MIYFFDLNKSELKEYPIPQAVLGDLQISKNFCTLSVPHNSMVSIYKNENYKNISDWKKLEPNFSISNQNPYYFNDSFFVSPVRGLQYCSFDGKIVGNIDNKSHLFRFIYFYSNTISFILEDGSLNTYDLNYRKKIYFYLFLFLFCFYFYFYFYFILFFILFLFLFYFYFILFLFFIYFLFIVKNKGKKNTNIISTPKKKFPNSSAYLFAGDAFVHYTENSITFHSSKNPAKKIIFEGNLKTNFQLKNTPKKFLTLFDNNSNEFFMYHPLLETIYSSQHENGIFSIFFF